MSTAPDIKPSAFIGRPQSRIDGPLKVCGRATYTTDVDLPGMLHAVPVGSTIASGRITSLEFAAAQAMPGVKLILHRGNIGRFYRIAGNSIDTGYVDENRPPFEDDIIRYYGQYVALVVAETFEAASAAAAAVKVSYDKTPHDVSAKLDAGDKLDTHSERGDPDKAFDDAPVKIDETYVTPVETHNPIELHATIAHWNGESYTFYETSQAVANHQGTLMQMMGLPKEKVRVISRYLGSGFGGKLWMWPHSLLAAAATRQLERPVKLVLSRKMMFQNVGHRPTTQQRVRLAATQDGKLVSLRHDFVNHAAIADDYTEDCGEATPSMYSTPNLRVTGGTVKRNVGSPTSMRGPGAVPGLFALESAMDELAIALKMDPVELRLRNEPEVDESSGLPFSSRHFVECLKTGAEKFGWSKRTPDVGSMKRDGLTLGWGVGACSWPGLRFSADATVDLRADGTARVACGTQDIGTGTYTILAQIVAEHTGIPLDKIEVGLGDTALPLGPVSGGSAATASVIPAVSDAVREAIKTLLARAAKIEGSPFAGAKADELAMSNGHVHRKNEAPESGVPFARILDAAKLHAASGSGSAKGGFDDPLKKDWSIHSYGAHFAEVTWEPATARLRVSRVVTVIDAGKILNPRAGRNQIEGAVVMGVGMALFEHTVYDERSGAPVNSSLADYVVATNADTPKMDVTFLDYPDTVFNELGARGIAEIGLAGIAAAITGAVYHATGVRVRKLPVMIEDLLKA
ncbi:MULTISPECIES: xanthine dehydrogenase family protein molybdopterin-binding subunit [Caballeronia]|jgi:xanthine dehydrogenase YagR molybdenum-binding subunit|uniref:Oxidoreductase n=1 Tax=Caballeronia zhejiangensis TaxID=871203 RepID=A0A656QMM8_9BURK|nr:MULTISPECIES: xanthine dehydrogenase family protein molybdopterin-binding subunit [Caballeronia]EKS69682.1 aldehyde oxidase and xanthine dehydrogenase molybdopterin binding protein [Burkholderia sp. SJ98]KDR32584.1 oxidoreductase [Caballeronia zhejiangensis]MCG7401089.1 xanthine dehydrogenase family protein molybdopterin-binding subunit [Caballeronia zhejiangensis]MCI1044384.1 xanthine dehydrogenase family protein molybdopterin-binding subunit [Caballeronia zhejiangensis]MDR5767275.1 xanthi